MDNEVIFMIGGLGDCLLHTPSFEEMFNKNKQKPLVYIFHQPHYDILLNNPFCIPKLISKIKFDELKKKEKKEPLFYGDLLPSISSSESASILIAQLYQLSKTKDNLQLFLDPKEMLWGKSFTSQFSYPIAFNPTSQCSKNQEWITERWAHLINNFPDFTFIQLGLESEELIQGAFDYRGVGSLREQLSILSNSNFYIGVESFWAHACSALNVPGIILFGDSNPEIWGHENNINIYKRLSCSPCIDWIGGDNCPYDKKCMSDIGIEEVADAINSLIPK